ncbi:SIS domain-containing protein [Novosphingobium sp. 1949]|uniref:SIS domain-containing protein n=1 Tax=Novosphingobium organovorum TaxID=2930092 RepID=A0ABT0BJE7_9SPHN|nr:SIS domain-containing protein [Novosphingobium organovorum]MCJ2184968.1 SIS domain-containing protein [Novosphingobium organovorum]
MTDTTLMAAEAAEGPEVCARFLAANHERLVELGQALRSAPPALVVTCARGSSDHAATYGKYLIETMTGVPVASAALSVASVYAARPVSGDALLVAISQSGRSPDLIATAQAYKDAGARVVALVNDETSPLAEMADVLIGLKAGPERSVAATKSYIAALVALAAMVGHWSEDAALLGALEGLSAGLGEAVGRAPFGLVDLLGSAANLFVIGRGYGFGVAQEAGLKLKETCGLHAEGFSAAEVRHGPMAIVNAGFPVLGFAGSDASGASVREAADEFAQRGAAVRVLDALSTVAGDSLAKLAGHPALEPILMIQAFYPEANALSLARGFDPDSPAHLRKVTETR